MTSVVVGTADLRAALAAVLAHASRDADLPGYVRIRLSVRPENVTITATDCFTAGLAIVSVLDDSAAIDEDIEILPGDASKVLGIFKCGTDEGESPQYQLRIDSREHTVTFTDVSGMFAGRAYKTPRLPTGTALDVVPIDVARAHHSEPVLLEDMSVTGDRLGRFKAAATAYGKPLDFESRAAVRALLVRCGESFLGLILPRITSEDEIAERKAWSVGWDARLPVPPPDAVDLDAVSGPGVAGDA